VAKSATENEKSGGRRQEQEAGQTEDSVPDEHPNKYAATLVTRNPQSAIRNSSNAVEPILTAEKQLTISNHW
jgi:hypothetical protein